MRIKAKSIDQRGVVSFITVSFLAGILILITMGFMRVMISNQRQSLDNQLSTQAFYAAESGINDVRSKLPIADAYYGLDKPCDGIINGVLSGNNTMDSTPIKYTCLLVDNTVEEILISDATTANGVMYQLQNESPSAINRIRISWGKSDQTGVSSSFTSTANQLPPASSWPSNTPAMLRLTIYAVGGNFSRSNLTDANRQRTYFIAPFSRVAAPSTTIDSSTPDGSIISAQCASSMVDYGCQATITLSGVFSGLGTTADSLFVRIRPIYNDEAPIKIEAFHGASQVTLINAQYVIDSTGRANDVYKRIKVRVPIQTEFNYPEYAAQTANSICKQFIAYPGFQQDEAGCSF
jgi:Tfp pilus assembly protein PilX